MSFIFTHEVAVPVSVVGADANVAVRRVYCVVKNSAAHAREIGVYPPIVSHRLLL
jgi:fumarylpyruvate hydrolase